MQLEGKPKGWEDRRTGNGKNEQTCNQNKQKQVIDLKWTILRIEVLFKQNTNSCTFVHVAHWWIDIPHAIIPAKSPVRPQDWK